MRIVLDTNIFVSAVISREGPPGRLLAAARRGHFVLITSAYQIDELRAVLGRDSLKPYILPSEADDLLYNLESFGVVVESLPAVDLSSDPKDNPILATGIAGEADLIVSGDKSHLLALDHVEGIPIVAPREAVGRLQLTISRSEDD